MPELPEVETTRRGIAPHLTGRRVESLKVRERRLRWPVSRTLARHLEGSTVTAVDRRAKYLLIRNEAGALLWHLGMSGSLRIVRSELPPQAHDHLDLCMEGGRALRFNDPRRFGFVLWAGANPDRHPRLAGLGPEPTGEEFNGEYMYAMSRGRRASMKAFVMDSRVVVGVGNIYASEALFLAGIHPSRPAGRVSPARMDALAAAVKKVLGAAIKAGGTTLRDFTNPDGRPGYFSHSLKIYGREGLPCYNCGNVIRRRVIAQRSTYFCINCQK
jgi:formamidopyrimidine-DNA glycosylase